MVALKKVLTHPVFSVRQCVFDTHHFGKGSKAFVINFPLLILLPQ
jgi:hypothetical protein